MTKRKLLYSFCLFLFLIGTSSCTFKDSSKINTYNFTVYASDWQWNNQTGRYECFFDFPELDYHTFEVGAIVGAVYINEGGYETQKNLPFSKTFLSTSGAYTETISFDTSSGNPGSVGFYIETSDKRGTYLATYDFKITLIGY